MAASASITATYDRATACVFSGTGNTWRTAQWLQAHASETGAATEVERITGDAPGIESPGRNGILFLLTPTHGFTAPWAALTYAARLPRGRGAHAAVLATRAGMLFGGFAPPGIAGTCPFILALILWLKGYRVRGTISVNMPSNWYSLHPIQKLATQQEIIRRGEAEVAGFAARLLDGRRVWLTLNNLYELLSGLALAPISLLYLVVGRVGLAKLFFANSNCDGCGTCAFSCPVEGIALWGDPQTRRPYWNRHCESCMRCAAVCPERAIEAGHSWAILLAVLSALVPASLTLLAWFSERTGLLVGLPEWTALLLDVLVTYAIIFSTYALFTLALRLRLVNWLFTRTTLTHYWGRYFEPQLKLKELLGRKKNRFKRPRAPAE